MWQQMLVAAVVFMAIPSSALSPGDRLGKSRASNKYIDSNFRALRSHLVQTQLQNHGPIPFVREAGLSLVRPQEDPILTGAMTISTLIKLINLKGQRFSGRVVLLYFRTS